MALAPVKEKEARIDLSLCKSGHSNPTLVSFFKKYRHNRVPLRQWGGKTVIHA